MSVIASKTRLALALSAVLVASAAQAAAPQAGMLFRMSADRGLAADVAAGDAQPNFISGVRVVADGRLNGAAQWDDDGILTWNAPANLQARRGTVSFFWRARQPLGEAPFNIFRVGYADHTSWDMVFLRIDWNGHGFDAFVTDTNLARIRTSFRLDSVPAPEAWEHLAFAWDEAQGVRLFLNGREVSRVEQKADLDAGLDQFGFAARILAPDQVQSRYGYMRGSDFDELRVYDHMLSAGDVAALAQGQEPGATPGPDRAAVRAAWLRRHGWDRATPPELTDAITRVRKVEFSTATDIREEMLKGIDGIDETTWPGVYNRSRLPGRTDYFELPDWNVYVEGGKTYDLTIPAGETVNRVEIRGAAYGRLSHVAPDGRAVQLGTRAQGDLRTVSLFRAVEGGTLRFSNAVQETPIQELWAYDVGPGSEPQGSFKLSYKVSANTAPAFANLAELVEFIHGRYPVQEQATVMALPTSTRADGVRGNTAVTSAAATVAEPAPIVHILIPSGFGDALPARPLARSWNYGWENVYDGLDGIAIDIPALKVTPGADGLIPLNIRVKDPIWPARDMIDLSVSVRPGQARTLWLDLRDRVLDNHSLYLSVASAAPDFNARAIDGMGIRLVFKDRATALKEHIEDRFRQVRENWGYLVEERPVSKRQNSYRRVFAEISDLLRVDPGNELGRYYWQDISYYTQPNPPFVQPEPPQGVPLWAFRQLEDLRQVHRFVAWWIDRRQAPYGDFGGGLSDDTDLLQQWPGLALMGVAPDKINASLRALSDAVYKNGMIVDGLPAITTDELHVYEEGLNSDGERLYLNWGEPRAMERLMATARALRKIVTVNPAGHLHFTSDWYGAHKVYRDAPWEWQRPYSTTVLQAPILLGVFNGNPAAREMVTGVMDGWLAHGRQKADGSWVYPNDINWRTDAERVGEGDGVSNPLQAAWAAYRFTGDSKYLRPLLGRVAAGGPAALSETTENAIEVLGHRRDWAPTVQDAATRVPNGFTRWAAWDVTGDRRYLEDLHADSIKWNAQHMYMHTEGHWWSDRVELPSEILQRERLGGVALKRFWIYPGNTVSWRFADPAAAEQVAILMPGATPTHFRVIAYNTTDRAQQAMMTTWNVTAGEWQMVSGTTRGDTDQADGENTRQRVSLERSRGVEVSFAPHATTIMEFTLVKAGDPVEGRPDLGIGNDDVSIKGRAVDVTVHSLGAQAVSGGVASLVDAAGHVVASTAIPALPAPLDLLPKTARLRLTVPEKARVADLSVRIALPGDAAEVTQLNNVVRLAGVQH